MALVTRRNPITDELESYWDPNIKIRKAVSDKAFEAGRALKEYAVQHRVTMSEIAKTLGVSAVDVSDTFRGLHEITSEMDAKYREAIELATTDAGPRGNERSEG